MKVTVKLFASLRNGRFEKNKIECLEDCSIEDIVEKLEITVPQVGICLINGRQSVIEDKLRKNDILCLFPHIGGG